MKKIEVNVLILRLFKSLIIVFFYNVLVNQRKELNNPYNKLIFKIISITIHYSVK